MCLVKIEGLNHNKQPTDMYIKYDSSKEYYFEQGRIGARIFKRDQAEALIEKIQLNNAQIESLTDAGQSNTLQLHLFNSSVPNRS